MRTYFYAVILVLVRLSSVSSVGSDEAEKLIMTPEEAEVNRSVVLSCYSRTNPIDNNMSWKLNGQVYWVDLTYSPCRADKYPLNKTDVYTLNCDGIHNFFSLTIRNVTIEQHGDTWQCESGFYISNNVSIYVKVPVATLDLTFAVQDFIAENQTTRFQCKTSFSRPRQEIYWFLKNRATDFQDDHHLIGNINESLANKTIAVGNRSDNILTSTESELALKVSRHMNKMQIYCLTNDTSGRVLRSTLVTLDISYPPDGPPYIRGSKNNATYSIIQKFQGNLTCFVTGGNPLPYLNWTCLQSGTQTLRTWNTTVINMFTWIASMDNNKMICTCKSLYLGEQSLASVSINVLYPPSLLEFYIQSEPGSWKEVSSEVNMKENNSFTMKCSSESNPVSTFSWTGPSLSINETLKVNGVNTSKEGSYTCTARNVMTQTNGTSLEGMKNNSIRVNVLYPPSDITFTIRNQSTEISVSKTVNMLENGSYILTCYARGKPEPTYSWTGPVNVSTDVLHFTNISRMKAGYYTCMAKNIINESTGFIYKEQEVKTIYLNIQYASQVTEFFVAGHKENHSAVTNQKENATFHCNVDSNPSSTIGLQFKGMFLVNNTDARNLSYVLRNLSCSNAGIYHCYSSNYINHGTRSRKQLTVIVKCPPLPEKDLNLTVTTLKYVPATLRFKAMDYLDSSHTSFTWQKETNEFQWETVKNDTNEVKISTFNLQTNLTIVNVTGSYSGKYRVVFNNSVGGNTQMFQVFVADLPDPPTYFDYFEDSLTSTKVTVLWTKGYGGGLRQTFVLNISQTLQIHINETEKENMQHTITGLSSGTQYNITLWATNKLGESSSQRLTIITKEVVIHSSANLTAPIAGAVSSVVAIVAGAFIAFLLYKRRTASAKKSDTGKLVYQNVPFEGKKQMKALPAKAKTHDVPVKEKTHDVPVKAKTRDVPAKAKTHEVPVKAKTHDVPVKAKTRDLPAKAAPHGLPVNTKAHDVQGKIKKKDFRGKTKKQEETSFQDLQEVDDMPTQYNERTEYYNSAEKIAEIEKIKVSELLPYVLGRGEESFETEYQKLPTGLEHPCTFARKPENIALNRYQGIYPYDHSRVKIEGMPEFFINACYINGYSKENEYIASLGPTKKVTYDFQTFWLMVWNERSDIIVMLTNLHEPSGMKCEQYWPEYETTLFYGDIQVSSDKEEVFAEYTVRVLTVSNSGERRTVTHLHYTAWPDKKVPEDVTTLIEFRERLKATESAEKGPVIVHCSAGIGRTGTLIALDRLIKEGQNESAVDVFKCVNSMRKQRVKMVQTLEQYIYIYKALVNSLYFNCETIPLESFNEYVDTTNNNIYSNQFQQLKETVEDCIKDKSDTNAENDMLVDKNRRGADIPGRQFRVLVYLNRTMNDSDYINAVYVNSFRIKDHFILAQSPLPNTVTDFVCMMYQENCSCVVTMEDLKEPGMKVGHYLPTDGQPLRFGDIQISCTVLETKPQYTVREMRLQNKRQTENREKVAYHFHYTKWMQGNDTPTDAKAFVQFIKDVEDYADQLGEGQSHVLVHCLKANERSALYSIVTILTEKIRYERQVSVLNTVRHLRTRRRTAITSMEQLKFCYQAVKAYINLFES